MSASGRFRRATNLFDHFWARGPAQKGRQRAHADQEEGPDVLPFRRKAHRRNQRRKHQEKQIMLKLTRRILRCKKGAALVEYALLVAGIALVGAASIAIFGHKTNDMVAMVAAVLPGAHTDDNAPIV